MCVSGWADKAEGSFGFFFHCAGKKRAPGFQSEFTQPNIEEKTSTLKTKVYDGWLSIHLFLWALQNVA